ncbi:cytochrome C oxidase subunit IV family protein [sulfur-oxidizing endosymbiont of Gigantopelta aegis]|uniref:cytochrome C oxidase subunit IV family protein n=1 Tax=sulfur-oxidizing endosymbiont of Gigantopelta aegis TaxID=2794934 RepID=UPI0018DCC2CE|nr:cytochrome C oxidase subunit IV family protein [sulfur-oxidizing endosymbiont of Gigantopelta aegis]
MSSTRFTSSTKLTVIWIILILLTLSSSLVAYFELSGLYIVAFVLLTVSIKGQLIIDYYMGMKNVRGFWRFALLGFIIVIPLVAMTGYYLSLMTVD